MIEILIFAASAVARPDSLLVQMQRLEASRNAEIKTGDMVALKKLYAPSFHGIAASGARVDREILLGVFKRNAGGDFVAESTILSARYVGSLVVAEGRLKLYTRDKSRLISDSFYLHVYRRRAGHWQMIEGASTPIPQSSQ